MNIKKILVPIDFSQCSLDALGYAGVLSKETGAEITLLHVAETYKFHLDIEGAQETLDDELERTIEAHLNKVIENQNGRLDGVAIDVRIEHGKIRAAINEVAREISADLIVMGTNGASKLTQLNKYFLGTNAQRTIQEAPCPVITLRQGNNINKINKILLPLDMERETAQKIDFAKKLAKVFNAQVHVVSVTDYLEEFSFNTGKLQKLMRDTAQEFANEGLEVYTKLLKYEKVADHIQEYAEQIGADLTIIMTRHEGAINELFMGSRARKMVAQMELPVMSIQPTAK